MSRLPALACLAAAVLWLGGCSKESEGDLIASAKVSLEKKDSAAAVIKLKNAIAANASSAEARFLLGKTLLETGDPVAAVVELHKAQELQVADDRVMPELARAMLSTGDEAKVIAQFASLRLPDAAANADLQTSVAVAYAAKSNPDKARQAIELALRSKPDYAPARVVRARLEAEAGATDFALRLLQELLAQAPGDERGNLLKAEILLIAKNDTEAALAAYRKALDANPRSRVAHAAIIALLLRQGKGTEARTQFAALKQAAPHHPETLYFDAELALRDKDYKRVREVTDLMLKAMPDNVLALQLAGAAEFGLQRYSQAEFFLGKALKGAPGLLPSRHMLAQSYLRLNLPHRVIEVLRPVLDGQSVDGTTLSLAGAAWLQSGEAKKAESAFQAAAKIAPTDARPRTALTLSRIARGNTAAIADLEAIAADDKGPQADLALISARLAQKDLNGALKAIDGLQGKQPEQPLAYHMRGRVLMLKRDYAAAQAAFELALSKDPHYFPAIASLAAIEVSNGKPEAARKRLQDVTKARPKDFQAFLELAELSTRTGATPAETLELRRAAVNASPGEATPHLSLIGQLVAAGEGKVALAAAQAATAALPNDLNIMEALGLAQLTAGEANQAVATLKKLAALQPTNPMHQVQLAEAHVATQDHGSAERALRQALAIQPEFVAARKGLVAVAILDRRPQDAVAMAREIQKKSPRDALGYTLEGDAQASHQAWDAAIAAYRSALQHGATTDTAVKLHGALRRTGKRADADLVAADWLKTRPRDAMFLYYLGEVALLANDAPAAEARYRAVLALQPNNPLALNNLAWLMVKQGKPGAVAVAEKATGLLPDRPQLMDTLAQALAAENQLPKAIEVQARAVQLGADKPLFKLNLARLYVKAGDKGKARTELDALARLGDKFTGQAEVAQLLKSL